MAYIEQRRDSWLVVWRQDGKKLSRSFRWGYEVTNFEDDGPDKLTVTKESARRSAEGFRDEMKSKERAARMPFERMQKQLRQIDPNYRPIFSGDNDYIGNGEDGQRFENYVSALIDRGAITDSAKATYRHTLKNHIAGTPLGRKNVGFIMPEDVEAFWRALDAGDGARRNIAQVLRKGFTRALKRGLIEVNPMLRADIEVPSKRRRVRGPIQVLEPEELAALAEAASSDRDRLVVKVMGYGGLRAGECGGLTRRDIVRRGSYCELRLHQQVVRVGREKKVTALKTEAAQRHVPVPCSLVDEIEAFLKHNPPAADGRVFHGPNGELVAAQGINNAVQRTALRAGLGPVNSHLLRHTAASLWFDDGMDAESVRQALGHSDIKTTLGLYSHMLKGGQAKLAESMARRIETAPDGTGDAA
jgi:integrase